MLKTEAIFADPISKMGRYARFWKLSQTQQLCVLMAKKIQILYHLHIWSNQFYRTTLKLSGVVFFNLKSYYYQTSTGQDRKLLSHPNKNRTKIEQKPNTFLKLTPRYYHTKKFTVRKYTHHK